MSSHGHIDTGSEWMPLWCQWAFSHQGRSGFVEGDAGKLHYLEWSDFSFEEPEKPALSPGEPKKPPLLLIHGFRAHARWWDMVAPYLMERYRVIALDLSGMGDSAHRDEYSPHCHADDIIRLIEALDLGTVTAVGHSFGGGRLLQACARRPELFNQAVVVDTHQLFNDMIIPPDPVGHTKPRFYPGLDVAMGRFRLSPEQPEAEDFLFQHVARHSLRAIDDGWTWKFDPEMQSGIFAVADADRLLPAVSTPVDVIYGSRSLVVPDELGRRVYASLSNPGRRICIPGGHHHLMLDQPIALISVLQALLQPIPSQNNSGKDN